MILGLVGTGRPFDRLVHALDDWAARLREESVEEVVVQIGLSGARPRNVRYVRELEPGWLERQLASATLVVAPTHLGFIRRALDAGVPVLVMPRHPLFGEAIAEHEIALGRRLQGLSGVTVVRGEEELIDKLCDPATRRAPGVGLGVGAELAASLQLIGARG